MKVSKAYIIHSLTEVKYLLLVVMVWSTISIANGQHAIQFSQYFSNQLILNPAYAGADDALSLTMVHRNQWTGVTGAPKTTTLSGHTLFKNKNTGLGINLFSDKINIHSNVSFTGIYSYRIKTGERSYLSLGLQAGINYVKSDYASLAGSIHDPNDPNIRFENMSDAEFQFGTGLYFRNPQLEFGLSAPILYTSGINYFTDSLTSPSTTPHYFLFTRYKIILSPQVQLHPGFLIKGKSGWPLAVDLNVDALFNEVLLFGLSYRSFETLSTIVQIKVLPQMKFGYTYEMPLKSIQQRNYNTHEVMLNYIFHFKDYNVKNPR